MQQVQIHTLGRQQHVADYRTSDKAILHRLHVRIPGFVDDPYPIQFDVQELIHRLQFSSNGQVVLQLDGDILPHERLKVRVEEHHMYLRRKRPEPTPGVQFLVLFDYY